jgi:DNA-binding helix-hairpin-helix protein with protein kinase domain
MTEKKQAPKKSGFVTMTNEELERIVSSGGLTALNNRELPAKPTYWIGVYTEKVEKMWKRYTEAREKLVKQFAEKDEDGNIIFVNEEKTQSKIPDDKLDEFSEEVKALRETVIEFTIKPQDKSLLQLAEELEEKNINLKPIELSSLRKFYK